MSYDPAHRRETPLAARLKASIRRDGPISVAAYMATCLNDPDHGYYRVQKAIGRDGDFVTAPEISQVFGELIGLWAGVVWQQMGQPGSFNLVEVGPGRGAMMADALRAMRVVPGMREAARVTLVEPSPVLAALQREALGEAGVEIAWGGSLEGIEPGPTIILANEVLDVFPVRQFVRGQCGWGERGVGLDAAGELTFVELEGTDTATGFAFPNPDDLGLGTVLEIREWGALGEALGSLARQWPLGVLWIDYGHLKHEAGDTLQAIRKQAYEDPLASPGEADLTAQVDFEGFARAMVTAGLHVDGPTTQAEFLGCLGAIERGSRLMAANPARAHEIEAGIARLLAPNGMGTRFKVLALRAGLEQALPGFAT